MRRAKIVAVVHCPILSDIQMGGVLAVINLYKKLSETFDVTLVQLADANIYKDCVEFSRNMRIVTICAGNDFFSDEANYSVPNIREYFKYELGLRYTMCIRQDKTLVEKLKLLTQDADVVISDHPYCFKLIKAACPDKLLCYRVHNVEYDRFLSYRTPLSSAITLRDMTDKIFDMEKECCRDSHLILTVAKQDAERFSELYGIPVSKVEHISFGFAFEDDFTLPSRRAADSDYECRALFISGKYPASVEFVKRILQLVPLLPKVQFNIVGSVCSEFSQFDGSENVFFHGKISEDYKKPLLKKCDLALCLINQNYGVMIKNLEYFSFGIPVMANVEGTRGLDIQDKRELLVTDWDNFVEDVKRFCGMDVFLRDEMALNARKYLERNHSWEKCAENIKDAVRKHRLFEFNDGRYNEVFIWGAGIAGKACLNALAGSERKIQGFIDADIKKQGKMLYGYPVISPEDFIEGKDFSDVIIATDYPPYLLAIYRRLLDKGFSEDNIEIYYQGEFSPCYLDMNKIRGSQA